MAVRAAAVTVAPERTGEDGRGRESGSPVARKPVEIFPVDPWGEYRYTGSFLRGHVRLDTCYPVIFLAHLQNIVAGQIQGTR
ncbi:hypothetical protein GMSM_07950 [Geomonas sp. Red276]